MCLFSFANLLLCLKAWGVHSSYSANGAVEGGLSPRIRREEDLPFSEQMPRRNNQSGERDTGMQKITPFLWFDTQAEEAAQFYVSIFPNSRIVRVARYGEAGPGPKGSV